MGFTEPKEVYNTLGQAFKKYPVALMLHEADLEATYLIYEYTFRKSFSKIPKQFKIKK